MYDPNWKHGHTFGGAVCRVLDAALKHVDGDDRIVIAFPQPINDAEYIGVVRAEQLEPVPAPKKRIQGWIIINRDDYGPAYIEEGIFWAKEHAREFAGSRARAIVYIDVEEGEGLEKAT